MVLQDRFRGHHVAAHCDTDHLRLAAHCGANHLRVYTPRGAPGHVLCFVYHGSRLALCLLC